MKMKKMICGVFISVLFYNSVAYARSVVIIYPRHQIWVDTTRLVFSIKEEKTDNLVSISLQIIEADDFESLFWGICNNNREIVSSMMGVFVKKIEDKNNNKIDIRKLFEEDMRISELNCERKTYYNY